VKQLTVFLIDRACIPLFVQPPWLVCVCWCRCDNYQHPTQDGVSLDTTGMRALPMSVLVHWKHYEANARGADESGGPVDQTDE
jgi:hypothetical protein